MQVSSSRRKGAGVFVRTRTVVSLVLCSTSAVWAQSALPGVATLTSTFDPTAPRLEPRAPITVQPLVMPPHTILPPAEYAGRKNIGVQAQSPRVPQPPEIEWSNRVLPQLPEVIARAPFVNTPTISWEAGQQTVFQPPDPDAVKRLTLCRCLYGSAASN
jgi:hypothetical protein